MAIAADRPRTRLPPPNRLRPAAGGIKIKIATHLRLTLAGQRAGHTGWCLSRKPVRSRINTGVFERPSRKLTRKAPSCTRKFYRTERLMPRMGRHPAVQSSHCRRFAACPCLTLPPARRGRTWKYTDERHPGNPLESILLLGCRRAKRSSA